MENSFPSHYQGSIDFNTVNNSVTTVAPNHSDNINARMCAFRARMSAFRARVCSFLSRICAFRARTCAFRASICAFRARIFCFPCEDLCFPLKDMCFPRKFPHEDVCLLFVIGSASTNIVPEAIFPNALPRKQGV